LEGVIENICVKSIVTCVPKEIEWNNDYARLGEQERELFIKKTGVEKRRVSQGKKTTVDLCEQAAMETFDKLGWKSEDIGLLIFVSQSADYLVPPSSNVLQKRLKLQSSTFLYDLNMGCTGWVNGLLLASSLMQSFQIDKALVLNGDTNILLDPSSNSSYPLIGDAACATALEISPASGSIPFKIANHGERYDSIIAPNSGARFRANNPELGLSLNTEMNGLKVFDYVSKIVIPEAIDFIEKNQIQADFLVSHQASLLVNQFVQTKLKFSREQSLYSLKDFGNTSSASIPLTICVNNDQQKLAGKELFCVAFGVGMSYAFVLLTISDDFETKLIEF